MIEFNGRLTGTTEQEFWEIQKMTNMNMLLCVFLLPLPAVCILSVVFKMWTIFLFYGTFFLLWIIITLIPRDKKEKNEMMPKRIYIEGEYITAITDKDGEVRKISDVKKVTDYGEFYLLTFPFGKVSSKFVCQKSLLIKGSLDEFESLFDGKIIRNIM